MDFFLLSWQKDTIREEISVLHRTAHKKQGLKQNTSFRCFYETICSSKESFFGHSGTKGHCINWLLEQKLEVSHSLSLS